MFLDEVYKNTSMEIASSELQNNNNFRILVVMQLSVLINIKLSTNMLELNLNNKISV